MGFRGGGKGSHVGDPSAFLHAAMVRRAAEHRREQARNAKAARVGTVDTRGDSGRSPVPVAGLKALAYWHGPNRIRKMAVAFSIGCEARGVPCPVKHVNEYAGEQADVVWMYGLGEGKKIFDATVGSVRIVGDKGYFAGHQIDKHIRVSINAQQPDAHLRIRPHPSDRFERLKLKTEPVTQRGEYILLCGIGQKQCQIQGLRYGQWEQETYRRLLETTSRTILVREKPKNPPIEGAPRSNHRSTAEAIRGAWAVVCLTGNIGVDAILHGVPVVAQAGPGAVYYTSKDVETIEPLSPDERLAALSDIAYWQWKRDELSSGAFWDHLTSEGFA
jgi:hypothetical protein